MSSVSSCESPSPKLDPEVACGSHSIQCNLLIQYNVTYRYKLFSNVVFNRIYYI